MPSAVIHVRRNRPPEEVEALIEAVYLAQREALRVPANDRKIRYTEHKPEHFAVPPGKTADYTQVEITLFPGRPPETKKNASAHSVSLPQTSSSSCTNHHWRTGPSAEPRQQRSTSASTSTSDAPEPDVNETDHDSSVQPAKLAGLPPQRGSGTEPTMTGHSGR